jgi:hypothetical protein
MPQRYHVVDRPDSRAPLDPQKLAQVLAHDGQLLLPMLDLIEQAEADLPPSNESTGNSMIAGNFLEGDASGPRGLSGVHAGAGLPVGGTI